MGKGGGLAGAGWKALQLSYRALAATECVLLCARGWKNSAFDAVGSRGDWGARVVENWKIKSISLWGMVEICDWQSLGLIGEILSELFMF